MSLELSAILVLGGLGFIFGIGLAIASKIFHIKEDPKKLEILNILPNANCGACGLAGCESYAEWLASDEAAEINKCSVGGPEVAKKIAAIIGRNVGEISKKVAVIYCSGGKNCSDKFEYYGIETCQASNIVFGGHKSCVYGCLGFGDCVKVCPFGAITQSEPGTVPVIDYSKCTGCGLCVKACPKKIINLVEDKFSVHVRCKSNDKGAVVRKICKTGCIGCGLCVKVCPVNDIVLENNLARIKYINCNNCGLCIEKCPTKVIQKTISVSETVVK